MAGSDDFRGNEVPGGENRNRTFLPQQKVAETFLPRIVNLLSATLRSDRLHESLFACLGPRASLLVWNVHE